MYTRRSITELPRGCFHNIQCKSSTHEVTFPSPSLKAMPQHSTGNNPLATHVRKLAARSTDFCETFADLAPNITLGSCAQLSSKALHLQQAAFCWGLLLQRHSLLAILRPGLPPTNFGLYTQLAPKKTQFRDFHCQAFAKGNTKDQKVFPFMSEYRHLSDDSHMNRAREYATSMLSMGHSQHMPGSKNTKHVRQTC